MKGIKNDVNREEMWITLKMTVYQTAKETCGMRKIRKRTDERKILGEQ